MWNFRCFSGEIHQLVLARSVSGKKKSGQNTILVFFAPLTRNFFTLENNTDMLKRRIYLDNAATTCMDARVTEAMIPWFSQEYGNASSLHHFGTQAREVLENSRTTIANHLGAASDELYFTSGGTESNNWALKSIAMANRHKGRHIIVSSIEHDCVLNTCNWLAEQGFFITYLPVDADGIVDLDVLKE